MEILKLLEEVKKTNPSLAKDMAWAAEWNQLSIEQIIACLQEYLYMANIAEKMDMVKEY